jgi:hypothetical protein
MPAHGFSVAQLVDLVRSGLATAMAQRVKAGREQLEVATLRITDAGRRALLSAGAPSSPEPAGRNRRSA